MITLVYQSQRSSSRRGSVLVCVIVCLSIVMALAAATTQSALRERRQVRVEGQLRQADLLVEAGVRRAVAKLNQSDPYNGETWSLGASALPGFETARVHIEAPAATPRQVRIVAELTVVADQPSELQRSVRRSFDFVFHPSTTPKE